MGLMKSLLTLLLDKPTVGEIHKRNTWDYKVTVLGVTRTDVKVFIHNDGSTISWSKNMFIQHFTLVDQ